MAGQNVAMAPQTFHMGSLLQEMREIEEAEIAHAPQRGGNWLVFRSMWPNYCKRTGLCLGQRGLIIVGDRGGRNSSCSTERWELVFLSLCLGQCGLIIARGRGGRNSSCTSERWELACV